MERVPISRDANPPIKRPDFNAVLYNIYLRYAIYSNSFTLISFRLFCHSIFIVRIA